MEVITYEKQTSKTKYIIEAALEYRPPLNISHNFFQKKKKSRGFYSRKYGSWARSTRYILDTFLILQLLCWKSLCKFRSLHNRAQS